MTRMDRATSIHFRLYCLLAGAAASAALAAALIALPSVPDTGTEALLFTLLAIPSAALAYVVRPSITLPLDLSYLLAASLLFPMPVVVIVAFLAGCAASVLSRRERRPGGLLAAAGLNAATLTAMAVAAWLTVEALWDPTAQAGLLAPAALALAGFMALVLAHILMMLLASLMRGEALLQQVRRYVGSVLAFDLLSVPISLLLALNLRDGAGIGFVILAGLALLGAFLLLRLDRARSDLSSAHGKLERRIEELRSLNVIGLELTSGLSPRQILETVARECVKIFPYDCCVAAVFDPESLELQFQIVRDASGTAQQIPQVSSTEFAGWVLGGFGPLLIRDLRKQTVPGPLRAIARSPRVRAFMASPLRVEGMIVGLLCMQSNREEAYDEHALSMLTALALQAGMAIENARNYQRATRDELTGLYQREYFFQRLQDELLRSSRYRSPFAILMLDLDGFKRINDVYGHLAGDRYLRALGETIRANLRAADIPGRFGGEEFCLLLAETDLPGAQVIAERIREAVAALEIKEGKETVKTTISIGIAVHPQHFSGTTSSLVGAADEALYAAKKSGRNRVIAAAA